MLDNNNIHTESLYLKGTSKPNPYLYNELIKYTNSLFIWVGKYNIDIIKKCIEKIKEKAISIRNIINPLFLEGKNQNIGHQRKKGQGHKKTAHHHQSQFQSITKGDQESAKPKQTQSQNA